MPEFKVGDEVQSNITGLEYKVAWCGKQMLAIFNLRGDEGMGYIDDYSRVPEPFFEVGKTYVNASGVSFDVEYVGHRRGMTVAFGWRSSQFEIDSHPFWSSSFGLGWKELTDDVSTRL